jgi:hypothetical protein
MNIANIRIELKNPFDTWDYFSNFGCVSGVLFAHKAWELEHTYYSPLLFDFEVRWTRGQDHAGVEIGAGILGYGISFRIYDTRHWNHMEKCWETHEHSEANG